MLLSLEVYCCELGSHHAHFLQRESNTSGAQTLLPAPKCLLLCNSLATWYVTDIWCSFDWHQVLLYTTLVFLDCMGFSFVKLTETFKWLWTTHKPVLLTNCEIPWQRVTSACKACSNQCSCFLFFACLFVFLHLPCSPHFSTAIIHILKPWNTSSKVKG